MSAQGRTVAFAASPEALDLDAGWPLLRDAAAAAGLAPSVAVWDDPGVDWTAFGLVVVIYTWGYVTRRERFLAWASAAARHTTLVNPEPVLRWNRTQGYLADPSRWRLSGVPCVVCRAAADAHARIARGA